MPDGCVPDRASSSGQDFRSRWKWTGARYRQGLAIPDRPAARWRQGPYLTLCCKDRASVALHAPGSASPRNRLCILQRFHDQLVQGFEIDIFQLVDIQAALAGLVFSKLFQAFTVKTAHHV